MIIYYNIKQMYRNPVHMIGLLVLLSFSAAILSLCMGLYQSAKQSTSAMDEIFTTIAIPDAAKIREKAGINDIKMNSSFAEHIPSVAKEEELYGRLLPGSVDENIAFWDNRFAYLAYSPDTEVLLSSDAGLNQPYGKSAFDVTCESVMIKSGASSEWVGNTEIVLSMEFICMFKVNEVLSLHPEYPEPDMLMSLVLAKKDSEHCIFEEGKRYIIIGDFSYNDSSYSILSITGIESKDIIQEDEKEDFMNNIIRGETNVFVEIEGDAGTFLISDSGQKWRKIIDNCSKIIYSPYVITTDRLESIPHFNLKKARILSGSSFDKKDYRDGNKVCIISTSLAEKNGIEIGDFLSLGLYQISHIIERWATVSVYVPRIQPYNMEIFQETEYEVIGIYQEPPWEAGEYMISPNTVFIPTNSLDYIPEPTAWQLRGNDPANLFTLIIKNGYIEEFKRQLQDDEIADLFLFFDQGYKNVNEAVNTVTRNSVWILMISVVIWLTIFILFLVLFMGKQKYVLGIMLSLGTESKRAFAAVMICCFIFALASGIIGLAVSYSVYDKAADKTYSVAFELSGYDEGFSDTPVQNANQGNNASSDAIRESFRIIKSPLSVILMAAGHFVLVMLGGAFYTYVLLLEKPLHLRQNKRR